MSSGGAGRSSGGSATVAPARAVAEATIDADDATAARLRALFEEHGFVIVRGVLPDDAVDAAKRGCAGLVQAVFDAAAADGAVASASAAAHLPLEKRLCELRSRAHTPLLFRPELHASRDFAEFMLHRNVLRIVSDLLPSVDELRIYPNYSSRPKLPGSELHEVVWHQDAGLRPDGGPNTAPIEEREDAFGLNAIVNVWSPLVRATAENGCMRFVPGTHKLGIQRHVQLGAYRSSDEAAEASARGDAGKAAIGQYKTQIDPAALELHLPGAVPVEMAAGDAVFFSNLLFHCGGNNDSDHIRWSFDWRFQDATKPTHRPERGHTVWRRGDHSVLADAVSRWESLSLS